MKTRDTLLLSRQDISTLMSVRDYVDVVEEAFRMYSSGQALKPEMMHIEAAAGEFHIKAGGLKLDNWYFGLKSNSDFSQNPDRFAMPSIQGLIVLASGENGFPLAIMDSTEITLNRTAAATAVAVKYLSTPEARTFTICGCGAQGQIHLRTLASMFRIEHVYVFSRDAARSSEFAARMSSELQIAVESTTNLKEAVWASEVCITCTRSQQYFLAAGYVSPGTFIAAIGADSPSKQELDPELLQRNTVVADIIGQCMKVGELHHALSHGMRYEDVYAELGEIVSGKKPGRRSAKEIIIFDSTGTALQDVAAAVAIYKRAAQFSGGTGFRFVA